MLVGKTTEADRAIKVSVNKESTAAQGTDFEVVEGKIPAGKFQGYIKVKLLNTEKLKSGDLRVYLDLEENELFRKAPVDFGRALILFGINVPAPSYPAHIQSYNRLISGTSSANSTSMDYYSPKAMSVIVQALGWTDWDDAEKWGPYANGESLGSYKYLPRYAVINKNEQYKAYALKIRDYITKYNAEHPDKPLLHDAGALNGKPITARE